MSATWMTPLGTTVIKEPVSVTWMTPFFFLDSSVWALPSCQCQATCMTPS
ncbi:MAG: hypothetical protein ACEY3H_02610 [Wolbachia sp.]